MKYTETAWQFACDSESLVGIAAIPEQAAECGILIVVGGPQYRVGSHRQFTLLSRELAADGFPVLRFDYRGMGDSSGAIRNFETVEEDLRAAVDQMFRMMPTVNKVVIWGLCDAASAAMMYAAKDARIAGLVLLNPWARSEQGHAKATLKHYYRARLIDIGFWKKVLFLRFNYTAAVTSLWKQLLKIFCNSSAISAQPGQPQSFHSKMRDGLERFGGTVLIIVSKKDLTGNEFLDMVNGDKQWRKLLNSQNVASMSHAEADHTFSRRVWRTEIGQWTLQWLRGI